MASKAKPYEQFGPYILFKKLESDALGELWRAARIDGNHIGNAVALRRLSGGHRTALLQSIAEARQIAPLLNGTTFVKGQVIDSVDAVPFIAFEYTVGRSLRTIVDRARAGNPIPLDQGVFIASRLALSLSTTADLRYGGERLAHGALIPQFVWITDDGEVRVAGQHIGKGIIASLQDEKVHAEISRFFSPECQSSGTPAKASEVYALGAMLFLLVTGNEPPDPLSVTAFTQVVRAAKTMAGQPIPLDIRTVLDKSLILDAASRYASVADMKQALDTLSAKYAATTFNLAFYLSTLLKKDLESEAAEREKEAAFNVAPYVSGAAPAAVASAPAARVAAPVAVSAPKSRMPLFAGIGVVAVAAIAAGAYFMMQKPAAPVPVAQHAAAAPAPTPKPAPVLPPPVLASTVPTNAMPAAGVTNTVDPNAAKKAFEQAVNQKLQEEMLKLQANFNKDLQQKKAKTAPVVTQAASPVAVAQKRPVAEEPAPSAAALDERRAAVRQEPPTQTIAPAPAVVQPQPAVVQAQTAPAPAPVQPIVHEGDVVDISDLDTLPKAIREPIVAYPPMALRQRIQTSVIVTALVSENGDVIDVRVLRGDPRFGFNDAAMRALRNARFTPPMKDGKRVKTWYPQTVNFRL